MVLPIDLPDEKLQQLIAHELTHVFQFEILFGGNYLRAATTNAPQWFLEGMASYFGNDEDNKDRMVLRDAVLADQVPEIAQRGIYGFFAYRFGHAVFDFIAAEWGRTPCASSSSSSATRSAGAWRSRSSAAFNVSAEDFDIRFRRFLRQRYLKILDGEGRADRLRRARSRSRTRPRPSSPRAPTPRAISSRRSRPTRTQADVVVMSTRDRKLYRNLTKRLHDRRTSTSSRSGSTTGAAERRRTSRSLPTATPVAVFARRERGATCCS